MKKTIALFLIASAGFMGSCKKDKTTDPEPETPVTPTEETLSGSLTVMSMKYIGSVSIPDMISATAFFYENPTSTNYIKVDCVIVNNVGLTYQSLSKIYQSQTNALTNVTQANWEVKGNNGIPSFTYQNKTGMPVYSGYGSIPNTISSAKDYNLTLTGLSNTDFYIVTLRDGIGGKITKTQLDPKVTVVTFTAAELAGLDADAVIQVTPMNNHMESAGGKTFSIQNQMNYYKDVTIN